MLNHWTLVDMRVIQKVWFSNPFYRMIARFMGPHGAHLGTTGPRGGPYGPREPCYLVSIGTQCQITPMINFHIVTDDKSTLVAWTNIDRDLWHDMTSLICIVLKLADGSAAVMRFGSPRLAVNHPSYIALLLGASSWNQCTLLQLK